MVGYAFKIETIIVIIRMIITTGGSSGLTAAVHQEISQTTQGHQATTTVECHLSDVHALFFHRRSFYHWRGNLNRRCFYHRLRHHHIGSLLRQAGTHIGQRGRSRRFRSHIANHGRNGRLLFLRRLLNRRLGWLLRLRLRLINRRCGGSGRCNRRSCLGFHCWLLACRNCIGCRALFLCTGAYAARRIVCQAAQGIAIRDGKGGAAIH